jgi:ankyrin repeat protein
MHGATDVNERLVQAAKFGDLSTLTQALEGGAHAKESDSSALQWAAERGHAECVKLLIPASDPLVDNSMALRRAAKSGHAECVRLLVAVSDPLANNSEALCWAAENGHVECVIILLPASEPKMDNSYALRIAAHKGHADCVALLLPASDPLATDAKGLDAAGLARARGHVEVAGMIEAFMEAGALSETTQNGKMNPRLKSAL